MLSKYKPMLVPPRPWRSASKGGHLTLATPVVRLAAGSRQQLHALQAVDKQMNRDEGPGAMQVRLYRLNPSTPVVSSRSHTRTTRMTRMPRSYIGCRCMRRSTSSARCRGRSTPRC